MLLIAHSIACAQVDSERFPFPIRKLDLQRVKNFGERNSIAWIDNTTLLFAAYEGKAEGITYPVSRKGPYPGLYEWNLETDRLVRRSNLQTNEFCFSNGYIAYRYWRGRQLMFREGVFGNEQERQIDKSPGIYRLTCRPYPPREQLPAAKHGGGTLPLLEGHGFIEVGADRVNRAYIDPIPRNLWYYAPNNTDQPKELPIPSKDVFTALQARLRYSRFADAYVLRRDEWSINLGMEGRVWLITREGRVTEITVPPGEWIVGSHYMPTARGMFMGTSHTNPRADWDAGPAGGYLVNGNDVRRFLRGIVHVVDVSPDGCKVATVMDPWTGPTARTQLIVAELCKDGS